MTKAIRVSVKSKIAHQTNDIVYVCGNSDYFAVFDFDTEWEEHEFKTARFIGGDGTYRDVVFQGNECPVPVFSDTLGLRIGVYAGDIQTTTPAHVNAMKSILCGGGVPAAPTDDVYSQIMYLLDSLGAMDEGDYIELLAQEDMLPAVHDGRGRILTDNGGNPILRY